mmetsp:Transcript_26716/g.50525  ORF Transcript_26716/g.50525 Transcript_26716/m.50525 type:complete len:657 (+) Transcript_26716:400-2370(+)
MPPDLEATGPLFLPREPEGLESPREFASCVHVNEKDKPLYTSRSFTDALRIVQENADPQKAKRNVLIALAEVLRWVHLKLKWSRELDPYVKVVLLHSSGWSKSLRTRAIINGGPSVVWDEDHRRQLTFPLPMDLAEHGAHFRMRLEVFDEQLSRDNLLGLRSRDISVLTAVAAPVEEEWKVFDTMNEQAGSVRFSYHLDVPEDHPPIRCLDPSLADARSNASKSPRARPSDDIFMQQGVGGEEGDAPGASESSSMARSVSSPPRVPNRGQPQNRRGNAEAAAQEMSSSSRSVVLESPKLAAIRTEEAGAGARAEDEPRVSRSAWAGGGSAARPRRKSNLVSVFRNDAVKQPLPPHMQAKLVVEMKSAHELHSRMMQVRVDRKLAKLAVVASIAYFVMGWLFYSFVEGWSFVQCLYFSVVTLTTTGYGDLHPTNNVSKLFTCMFAFCGIGVITSALGLIGGYLFEEQSRAILETMAVMKMHNQDRSHILTFRPKDQTNDRPGNDSPFRMAISATQRGIGLTPPPASPKSPFEGKTGLGWAILRGARKVTPLAGTTFKKMVQRKDLDMTPRREAVTEDSGDGGVSLKKVVAYTWSIVVMIFVGVLMFKFHDGYTFVSSRHALPNRTMLRRRLSPIRHAQEVDFVVPSCVCGDSVEALA